MLQNIFMRYGASHQKIFVLPPRNNYLGHPQFFHRSMVPDPNKTGYQYNIFTHHTRFDYAEIKAIMPADSTFVTVLRDPVDLFESMFTYYRLSQYWNFTLDHLDNPEFKMPLVVIKKRFGTRIGWNQMFFDLGMNITDFLNLEKIDEYIFFLDEVFKLVMISERMDESLILLKELLCWTIDDIVAFKVNSCG